MSEPMEDSKPEEIRRILKGLLPNQSLRTIFTAESDGTQFEVLFTRTAEAWTIRIDPPPAPEHVRSIAGYLWNNFKLYSVVTGPGQAMGAMGRN